MSARREDLHKYIGTGSQAAFLQECRLSGGRAEGVRAIIAHAGNGLEFMVLPDRAMDIPYIFYKGRALHFASPTGIVHPHYYDPLGTGWLKGFFAGALTTCGITFCGQPEKDGDRDLGLHGPLSYIPAEQVRCYENSFDGHITLRMEGRMREVSAFGDHVELHRSISTDMSQACITIVDHIRNRSAHPVPLMMLYHFNFGYPLLNENSRVYGDFLTSRGGNEISSKASEIRDCRKSRSPVDQYDERVFFHSWKAPDGQRSVGLLEDPEKDSDVLGVVLSYDGKQLPDLVQWKMMQSGSYVMGLEPCTVFPTGRESLRKSGTLPMLEPGESRRIAITYHVTETRKEFETLLH